MNKNRQPRIHIIDDSKDMQALLSLILESNGFQVDCSANGAEALMALKTGAAMPDVILLDSLMPVMDGTEFMKARRDILSLRDIPVILMTGEEEATSTFQLLSQEVFGFLKKPFQMSAVLDAVTSSFQPHKTGALTAALNRGELHERINDDDKRSSSSAFRPSFNF